MTLILQKPILAAKLLTQGNKAIVGEKIPIATGMAIEKGDDNPMATTIVISFNGEKYLTDKMLLEKALKP